MSPWLFDVQLAVTFRLRSVSVDWSVPERPSCLAAEARTGNGSSRQTTHHQVQRHMQPSAINNTLQGVGVAYS